MGGRKCKRIIDGKTYNTETATQIAGSEEIDGSLFYGDYLYQTRFGAFFLVYSLDSAAGEDDYVRIKPLSPDEARIWLEKNASWQPQLIEKLFGEMPEAGSGEIKFTLRLPESLRNKLNLRAEENNQSLNAWIVRCLERCISSEGEKG